MLKSDGNGAILRPFVYSCSDTITIIVMTIFATDADKPVAKRYVQKKKCVI